MASVIITLIGACVIVFFLWCGFGPVERDGQTEPLGPNRTIPQREDPRPELWALGAAALGIALLAIGIIGMVVPLVVSVSTP